MKKFFVGVTAIILSLTLLVGTPLVYAESNWHHEGVTLDKSMPQKVNSEITLTANASGDTNGLQYKFIWTQNDWQQWGEIKDFDSSNTATWKPTKKGDYTIYSYILDSKGYWSIETVDAKIESENEDAADTWEHEGIMLNKVSPQKVGSEITLTAKASGDTDGLQYKFEFEKNDGGRELIKDFNASNTATWSPTEEGEYKLYSCIKDKVGESIEKVTSITIKNNIKETSSTVKENAWQHDGITLNKPSPQKLNSEINLKTEVSGDTTGLQYKFVWMRENWDEGNWGVIRDFTDSNTAMWKPTQAGNYTIYADIKEPDGKTETKTVDYKIVGDWNNVGVLIDKSSPVRVNTTVNITSDTRGETGGLQYKFVWMRENWDEGNWGVIKDFSETKTASWIPEKAGNYKLYVDVRDAVGRVCTKTLSDFKVTAGSSSMNSLTISNDSATIPAGKTFYLKAVASPASEQVYFSTNNSSVATVSSRGLIYGVGSGTAKITAYDASGSITKTCNVTVTKSEPVKFAYTSPNNATLNSKVDLIAITDKNRDAVKFVINGKEIVATNKVPDSDTYVWTASVIATAAGETQVKAYSRQNGNWETCSDAQTSIYASTASKNTSKVEARRVSDEGINFIAQCEGFVGTVYDDPLASDTPTMGYGKVIYGGDTFYNNLTQKEAYAMLIKSVNNGAYSSSVNSFLINNGVKFNQVQFDSLVSFSYNLETGWMSTDEDVRGYIFNGYEPGTKQRNLSNVNRDGFSYEMIRYHHGGGNACVPGLLYRRIDEMNMFFYGDYTRHTYKNNPHGFRIPECIIRKGLW